MIEYCLNCDIVSQFNRKDVYGRKGDKVKLISDHGNLWVVENIRGNRFSASAESISQVIVEKDSTAIEEVAESIPDKKEEIVPPRPTRKKTASKKVKPNNQQSIF